MESKFSWIFFISWSTKESSCFSTNEGCSPSRSQKICLKVSLRWKLKLNAFLTSGWCTSRKYLPALNEAYVFFETRGACVVWHSLETDLISTGTELFSRIRMSSSSA